MAPKAVRIEGTRLRDVHGREVTFHGINVSGDAKCPRYPDQPSHNPDRFFDGDDVSFVGRPFSEDEAHHHFGQLKRWGYNVLRYVFTWEAIEHAGPGQYDEDYIQHTIKILRIAKTYGFLVFMDPHQDVWSRFTAGSGAPMWTLYAAGLDPETFSQNQAALVQNTWPDPAAYPKMLWPTNYQRLACSTMFNLFYAGRDYAPNAIIDGKNIQDFLTDHFINACVHLAKRIHEAGGLEDDCIIGWESLNEPNRGLLGWQNMTELPADLNMRKGTCPTPWQSLLTGSGRPVEIDVYDFGSFGPSKTGTELVDPAGTSAWLATDKFDRKYGWKRDPGWKLGVCLWAQQGIWNPDTDELLKPDVFAKFKGTQQELTAEVWSNTYFLDHFRKYRDAIRQVHKDCIILMQSAVLEIPPAIKGTPDDEDNLIFASHYYDGLTLIKKHWNKYFNVDVFGILRGKYLSPAFAVRLGETAIRNCLRDQLSAIREEGLKYTGVHPCLFTEIGIPFDMDDKYAYKTGDYGSQVAALDANSFALEGSGVAGYTLWAYVGSNNHQWGDNWNGEDLSIFSVDDKIVPSTLLTPSISSTNVSTAALSETTLVRTLSSTSQVNPSNLKSHIRTPTMEHQPRPTPPELSDTPGYRAAQAFLRPTPTVTHGDVLQYGFDLKSATFTFSLSALSPTPKELPTQIFLPDFHFPADQTVVEVSGGKWAVEVEEVNGEGMQRLKWWHGAGEQSMTVRGVVRQLGEPANQSDESFGYYEMLSKAGENCTVM